MSNEKESKPLYQRAKDEGITAGVKKYLPDDYEVISL
jgi:hypothetical protein